MLIETLNHTLETEFPVIKRSEVSCNGEICVLTATLNDLSDQEKAAAFDRLLNSEIEIVLARNGFHSETQPVVRVMGGTYTGFSLRMRRSA